MTRLVVALMFIFISLSLNGCIHRGPTSEQLSQADYGSYPNDYREIIGDYIKDTFYDPYSVQDVSISSPQRGWYQETAFSDSVFGYKMTLSVNAKNRMGAYTGRKTYYVFIRNGTIMKVEDPQYVSTY